jgi:hypothetical protein
VFEFGTPDAVFFIRDFRIFQLAFQDFIRRLCDHTDRPIPVRKESPMKKRQLKQYEMLQRVRDFGSKYGTRFPEKSVAGRAFKTVETSVAKLSDHEVERLQRRRDATKARKEAKAALFEMLEDISRTAQAVQLEEPTFPNTFLMPERRSAQAVLTAARLFARNLEAVAAMLMAHAMPETVVADFTRLLETYEAAVRNRDNGKGQTAATLLSIDKAIDNGIVAAKKLDAVVANHLKGDATLIAEWERDRKIGYPRPPKDGQPVVGPTKPVDPKGGTPTAPVAEEPISSDISTPTREASPDVEVDEDAA